MSPKTENGCTLIELLVGIAIIGILAAMLLPALQKAKDRATTVQCLGNMKDLALAFSLYADDHNEEIPYVYDQYFPILINGRYIKDIYAGGGSKKSVFQCPAYHRTSPHSYSLSHGLIRAERNSQGERVAKRRCDIKYPSELILLGENDPGGNPEKGLVSSGRHMYVQHVDWRHLSELAANFAMVDGHVETIRNPAPELTPKRAAMAFRNAPWWYKNWTGNDL